MDSSAVAPHQAQRQSQSQSQSQMTRSGGACFVCRAKKRKFNTLKCSGHKPCCNQCKSSDLHCVWPKQQKRGIPKDFIKKLEARLRRTEAILCSVLPHVSDQQLELSLRDIPAPATDQRTQDKENADPQLWELYPLSTLQDVRAWQALTVALPAESLSASPGVRQRLEQTADSGTRIENMEMVEPSPNGSEDSVLDQVSSDFGRATSSHHQTPSSQGAAAAQETGITVQDAASFERQSSLTFEDQERALNATPLAGRQIGLHEAPDGVEDASHDFGLIEAESGTSSFLPADFQKQFLW